MLEGGELSLPRFGFKGRDHLRRNRRELSLGKMPPRAVHRPDKCDGRIAQVINESWLDAQRPTGASTIAAVENLVFVAPDRLKQAALGDVVFEILEGLALEQCKEVRRRMELERRFGGDEVNHRRARRNVRCYSGSWRSPSPYGFASKEPRVACLRRGAFSSGDESGGASFRTRLRGGLVRRRRSSSSCSASHATRAACEYSTPAPSGLRIKSGPTPRQAPVFQGRRTPPQHLCGFGGLCTPHFAIGTPSLRQLQRVTDNLRGRDI